jgi:molecular chaperone IbpA
MSRNDLSSLFDRLEAHFVGFGPTFRDFQFPANNYPPHNIRKVSDTEFYLELAVAGFKKDEIEMEECQGLVTIRGNKKTEREEDSYQYRGIAARSFTKTLRVAEYFEVNEASIEDGILTVKFVKNVPEEAKPKLIAIK